jgi:hypothetical protein
MSDIFQLEGNNLDLVNRIRRKYVDSGLSYGWKANNSKSYDQGHWNKQILINSSKYFCDHSKTSMLDSHNEVKTLWNFLQEKLKCKSLSKIYINGYTFGTDGYAHQDESWITKKFGNNDLAETTIIYLNPSWDIDWSGETVIYENLTHDNNSIVESVLPKLGRVFTFQSNKYHASRPLSRFCPVLRSILVIKTVDPVIITPQMKFITEVTPNIKHSGRTFFGHLFGTMLKLENRNKKVSDDVLLAGLYHSIYGTEYFEYKNSEINRDVIKELIGEYAEQLVYEFCNMKDRVNTLLTNSNQYSTQMLTDLITIEICNLQDQNHNGHHNNHIHQLENKIAS